MRLLIHDNLSVEDVQDRFSDCFLGLKIEFYTKPHHWKEASKERDKINPNSKLLHIRKNHNAGILEIKSTDTVGKVEKELREMFDLNVQVFRKAGDAWVQTTTADINSLHEEMTLANKEKLSTLPLEEELDEYEFS